MVDVWSTQYDTSNHSISTENIRGTLGIIPCVGTGKVHDGVCKSCMTNRVYNPVSDSCDLVNVSMFPLESKICPLPLVSIGNQCRYPCPPGLNYSESTNECVHDKKTSIPPTISPVQCPLSYPYLQTDTMTCHDRPMILEIDKIPIGKSYVPYEAESSLLL